MKQRTVITGAVVVAWLAAVAWLIRYEAYPHFFTGTIHMDYQQLLTEGPLLSDSWMKIIMQGTHVGYSHTVVEIDETNPNQRFILRNTTDMTLNMLDRIQPVLIRLFCGLDALYKLQNFEFSMKSSRYAIGLNARRSQHDTFHVNLHSPAGVQSFDIELPPDVVIYSPAMQFTLQQMKPGQTLSLTTLDPASLRPSTTLIRALRTETITWKGADTKTLVLAYSYGGGEMTSWLDMDTGVILRQETPWGWTLEASDPVEAVSFDQREIARLDQAAVLAIPVDREIPEPRAATRLRIAFSGGGLSSLPLASHRQTVLESSSNEVTLEVAADCPDAVFPPGKPLTDDELRPYLQSTIYVQAAHPEIRQASERITQGVQAPLDKALAIHRWVYQNVKKEMTVSLPSALDVLKMMSGDCNEHTYLFTALARAARIPTRIQIGIVFMNDAFYYHAWPAVWVGRWLELDPTFGQEGVDATHIALLEGELAEQMQLLQLLGQTSARILDVSRD